MKEITITVAGATGSGKTLVAAHLAAYLAHNCGFPVTLRDEGQPVPVADNCEMPFDFKTNITIITEKA